MVSVPWMLFGDCEICYSGSFLVGTPGRQLDVLFLSLSFIAGKIQLENNTKYIKTEHFDFFFTKSLKISQTTLYQ